MSKCEIISIMPSVDNAPPRDDRGDCFHSSQTILIVGYLDGVFRHTDYCSLSV